MLTQPGLALAPLVGNRPSSLLGLPITPGACHNFTLSLTPSFVPSAPFGACPGSSPFGRPPGGPPPPSVPAISSGRGRRLLPDATLSSHSGDPSTPVGSSLTSAGTLSSSALTGPHVDQPPPSALLVKTSPALDGTGAACNPLFLPLSFSPPSATLAPATVDTNAPPFTTPSSHMPSSSSSLPTPSSSGCRALPSVTCLLLR